MNYIVELGLNYKKERWVRSSDLPGTYYSKERAQKAIDAHIDAHTSSCKYRVTEVLDPEVGLLRNKLNRIQEVLNSKTKAEQIQDILNEGN